MNMINPLIATGCAIVCVAPATMAQEAAAKPTALQIVVGGVEIIDGTIQILKEVKDAETAAAANAGIKELVKLAKALDEASKNAAEPTEEEVPEIQKQLEKAEALAQQFVAQIQRLASNDLMTEELDTTLQEFMTVTGLDSMIGDGEGEDGEGAEDEEGETEEEVTE